MDKRTNAVPDLIKEKNLHMIGNAHIDPVWLWQWQEGFHEVRATFYSVLRLMKEYEDFMFVSSSAAFYEWIEEIDPEMFAEIKERVSEGRWGIVGGWWIQPDCNIPGGESFVRQGLYGQRYFKEKFGVTATVGYNVDSFGHHGMLPQILKKSGMDSYIFMRPSPHEKGLPARLFWWEADDGSRVLAFRIPYEYSSWGQDLEKHVQRCSADIKPPIHDSMCFYGVGNHGGGPTRENLNSIRRLMEDPTITRLGFNTPEGFFKAVQKGRHPIPVVHDELQHHASGCYSVHSGVKQWNRQAENLLAAAEKFSVIAKQVTGQPYATDLARAWKNVLFNQFHDILAGTSIEPAYEDARHLYGEAMSIAGRALNQSVQALSWKINLDQEDGTRPVVVFNPHAWASRLNVDLEMASIHGEDVLLDADGNPVAFQEVQPAATSNGRTRLNFIADVPSLGYSVFRLVRSGAERDARTISASDTSLENERFRLEFDAETGFIKSLWDKRFEVEVFAGPAAKPVVISDPSDTWGHNIYRFDRVEGSFKAVQAALVERGPVKSVIRVASEYGSSRLIQDFTMYRDLEQIDVRVTVDWREKLKMLKLRFPVNLDFMRSVYEIPYGSIERYATGEEEPGQTWVDLSGVSRSNGMTYGLSLLNDSKYSFDVQIRDIGLTVLRSPVYANHGPAVPHPDGHYAFIDHGIKRFTYTLLPHSGSWEEAGTVRRAAELNQPAIVLPATFHPGPLPQRSSYLSVEPENVVATVLKQAEDSEDIILRCWETAKAAAEAVIRIPLLGREFHAAFGPAEIKTFRIPRDENLPVQETNLLEWDDQI